jgi:hypothetical protein
VTDVVLIGGWMIVLWFGFWVPMLLDLARARARPTWVAWALSPFGPLGAVCITAGRTGSDRRRESF